MLKVYFNKRILLCFFLALAILAWLAISSYNCTRQIISSSRWVAHTHDVLYRAERLLGAATSIENGQRGFILTGNEKFLDPYNIEKNQIYDHFSALQQMTLGNADQQALLQKLEPVIDRLLVLSSDAIKTRKSRAAQAQEFSASLEGKHALDEIRTLIRDFQDRENALLATRALATEGDITSFGYNYLSLLTITGLIIGSVFYGINASLKARTETDEKLKKASEEIKGLYDNAPCGYHSLNAQGDFVNINETLVKWLGYNRREEVIKKLKFTDLLSADERKIFEEACHVLMQKGFVNGLELNLKRQDGSELPVVLNSAAMFDTQGNYIQSRSSTVDNSERRKAENEMKELARELEAFSYSVSHDLRAPLRSVDGYTRVLQEDYADKFDDEGRRVIHVIMSNAKRMGQLIDDLLDFARVGRKDVVKTHLDMTAIVQSISSELTQREERNIQVTVHPLTTVPVDLDMIRQVWVNLISNAIKYTGKTPDPKIEISSYEEGEEVCYRVKDNGVGFDMQYSGKLFGVFQRLHKMQDFTGTGVGLAIVKRIVGRHNGRVWAESQINNGATFYFTIPHLNGKQ
jgi:PAS domain S-box-containing protein